MRRHHETAHGANRAHFAGFRQDGRLRPPKGPARSPVSLAARQQYKLLRPSPNRPPRLGDPVWTTARNCHTHLLSSPPPSARAATTHPQCRGGDNPPQCKGEDNPPQCKGEDNPPQCKGE